MSKPSAPLHLALSVLASGMALWAGSDGRPISSSILIFFALLNTFVVGLTLGVHGWPR